MGDSSKDHRNICKPGSYANKDRREFILELNFFENYTFSPTITLFSSFYTLCSLVIRGGEQVGRSLATQGCWLSTIKFDTVEGSPLSGRSNMSQR